MGIKITLMSKCLKHSNSRKKDKKKLDRFQKEHTVSNGVYAHPTNPLSYTTEWWFVFETVIPKVTCCYQATAY